MLAELEFEQRLEAFSSRLREPERESLLRTDCPVCGSRMLVYEFSLEGRRIVRCANCALLMLNPQPSDAELSQIYSGQYILLEGEEGASEHITELKRRTAGHYLELIAQYRGCRGGTLLEVGCGAGDLLDLALQDGFEVTGTDLSAYACRMAWDKTGGRARVICCGLESIAEPAESFDVIVLADVLEHVRDPRQALLKLRSLLKPGGLLFLATPSLDSWSARLLRQRWMDFKLEHLTYFNRSNIQTLALRCGFGNIVTTSNLKYLSLDYVRSHFEKYPVAWLTDLVKLVGRLVPQRLCRKPVPVVASGMIVMATKTELRKTTRLSIVVPAYNEAATLDTLLGSLVQKNIEGLETEIIVVESNSNDGTREIAEAYSRHGLVRLIKEDVARGKGHATRAGLEACTGEIIMIQDADLEYDLEDYEALLQPILTGRKAFVLGARHGGSTFKMRRFDGQPLLAAFMNLGHWLFTALVDILFLLRLRDPMTMYKVFRRDCLHGLRFECNRFDFDYELLIKLIRKGYSPIEIPVNYRSRTFESGKKVSILRDPWTWLWALMKLRFAEVNPLREMERRRR